MPSIESKIKTQYAKFFEQDDWRSFKKIAECHLETAARLKKRDVKCEDPYRLLLRNIQKRLFIGIGCELIVKAFYLKNGYGINRPKQGVKVPFPYKIREVNRADFQQDNTYQLGFLLDHLKDVCRLVEHSLILRGFRIAKVFRNKEAHAAVYWHQFDPNNYLDIEISLAAFYLEAFSEKLTVQFSLEPNEKARFNIAPGSNAAEVT